MSGAGTYLGDGSGLFLDQIRWRFAQCTKFGGTADDFTSDLSVHLAALYLAASVAQTRGDRSSTLDVPLGTWCSRAVQ